MTNARPESTNRAIAKEVRESHLLKNPPEQEKLTVKAAQAKARRRPTGYHRFDSTPVLQILSAYYRMAKFYRPAAEPERVRADLPPDKAEYRRYLAQWVKQEDTGDLRIFFGCCDFDTRPSAIYAVEAARAMNAGQPRIARRLLNLALTSLDEAVPPPRGTRRIDAA